MCETGHSATAEDLRGSIEQLEQAVARHEAELAARGEAASHPSAQVLRRSVQLMREEAARLRAELRD